jgi:hypothetical protein
MFWQARSADHSPMPATTSIAPPQDPRRQSASVEVVGGVPARRTLALNPGPRPVGDFSHLLRSHD